MDVNYCKSVLTGASVLSVVLLSKQHDIYNDAPYFLSSSYLAICNIPKLEFCISVTDVSKLTFSAILV